MEEHERPGWTVWDCKVCVAQMFGGPRCTSHNPSPEERDARKFGTNEPTKEEAYAF